MATVRLASDGEMALATLEAGRAALDLARGAVRKCQGDLLGGRVGHRRLSSQSLHTKQVR